MSGPPRPWNTLSRRDSRLRLAVARLQVAAAASLCGGLIAALIAVHFGMRLTSPLAQQAAMFVFGAAGGLGGLALAGRMWLTEARSSSVEAILALTGTAAVVALTGGPASIFAALPIPIAMIVGPHCRDRSGCLITSLAAAVLAMPLLYDFRPAYLILVAAGLPVIIAGKLAADRLALEVSSARGEARELQAVAQASSLATILDLQVTLQGIVDAIRELLQPHACVVYMLNPVRQELRATHMYFDPQAYAADHEQAVRNFPGKFGQGLVGSVAAEGTPLLLRSVLSDPRSVPIPGTEQKDRTYIVVPLRAGDETFGVLRVSRDDINQYDEDDLTLTTIFANQAAAAIANARLFERVKSSEELTRLSEARYERLTRHAGEAIMTYSFAEERVVYVNAAMEQLLGYTLAELQANSADLFGLVHPDSQEAMQQASEAMYQGAQEFRDFRLAWLARNGRPVILEHTLLPLRDEAGRLTGLESIARDVTERERMESEIRELTFNDQLTGVYNRAFFEQELKRLDRPDALPLTVIMGDINGLKLANDAFGHGVGDQLLIDTAQILRSVLRRSDVICRWGGDEFAIILPNADAHAAAEVIGRIRSALGAAEPNPIPLSIALGVATKSSATQDMGTAIREAEDRMYRNKLLESKSTHSAIVASLQKTLWEKTHETEEHARRLQKLVERLGRALGLRDDVLTNLSLLAILHDVGKVGIPDGVLSNPGALSADEWEIIRRHPEIGYRIAAACPNLAPIAGLILSHHERWDGQGYPRGLSGESIPIPARVLAVADAFDVMTNGRPYRPAMSEANALVELERCAGSQFDPHVVKAFCQIVRALESGRLAV